MPALILLLGISSGLSAVAAGLAAGLPVLALAALYLCVGSLSVLTAGGAALLTARHKR